MLTELAHRFEWLAGLIDFAFPPLCLGCGDYCEAEEKVCETCFRQIIPLGYPICLTCHMVLDDGQSCPVCEEESLPLAAYGYYREPLTGIIRNFKFKSITTPARVFGRKLIEQHRTSFEGYMPDFLLPVPLHPNRQNRRGYNQAELLAKELSVMLEIPVAPESVFRTKRKSPQSRLSPRHRAANIRGVFQVYADAHIQGRVMIVDDVVTTGSTVRELTRTLRAAGIEVIGVVALAYGGHDQ